MIALMSAGVRVTVGVDTHADVHVAAAFDQIGRLLATRSVPSTPADYRALVAWAARLSDSAVARPVGATRSRRVATTRKCHTSRRVS
jgi:hypothetical protein